jgi:large subunit ribosomal protein L23
MLSKYNIIKKPLITEKAVELKEGKGKVAFAVDKRANKLLIKNAVEEYFKVKVESVATMNYKGKNKRFGMIEGKRQDWKKAVVTLKKGEKLEFV